MLRTSAHRLLAATTALATVLVLAGCGGSGGDDSRTVTNQAKNPDAARSLEPSPAAPSVGASPAPDAAGAVTFADVTVADALDREAEPTLTSTATAAAPGLLVQDLIVGTGPAATPTSSATSHYTGVLYDGGARFDTNWSTADPDALELGTAVAGFAQGIGGTTGVDPMKVGGRRLIVFPASLGYGAIPYGAIPAHSSLVFVVDLLDLP